MQKYEKENKFYRVVLLLAALLYISFAYFFNYLLEIVDPMTIQQRFFGAGIFFITFLLSHFNNWIKKRLEGVTYTIVLLAIIQMIFINFTLNFDFQMAISIILTVVITNILFKADKTAIYSNIFIAILIFLSLVFIENFYNFLPGFYLSYLLAAFISLYVSFKRTENEIALIKSEKSYRNLVDQMQLGLAEHEMIYDEDGKPVDFKFISINDSYEKLTGLSREEVVGRMATDVLPEMENYWINEYGKVVLNDETREFENYSKPLDKTFDVTAYSIGEDKLITIVDDITKRKRYEDIVKELHNIAVEFKEFKTEDEICKKTVEAAEKLLNFNMCHISLVKDNQFIPIASSDDFNAKPHSINEGIAGKTLIENKSFFIDDILDYPEVKPTETGYSSGISIPIKNLGVFQTVSVIPNAFNQNDLELAEILISHTTSALKRIYFEKEIKDKNIMLSKILESIQDGIAVINPDLTVRYTNDKMKEWYSGSTFLSGKECYKVFNNAENACPNCPTLRAMGSGKLEKEIISGQGKGDIKTLEIFSYPIIDDETEKVTGVVEYVRDITERKKKEEEIKYLLYRDELTDLYNRRFFEEEFERLDTERQLPISLIMGDLNGLKLINDSFGHKEGDKLLLKAADILKESTRDEDILARWAGDEFVMLLPKTQKEEAEKIIDRIKTKCMETSDDEIPVSLALGAATKTKKEQVLDKILKFADDKMYKNKLKDSRNSKNRMIKSLLDNLSEKCQETEAHSMRMTKLAYKFGEELRLSVSELDRLSLLATLHDIGKTTISKEILNKPGQLTDEEWEIMKKHTERGYKISAASEEFAVVAKEILSHHERWDGKGYPQGLKGEEIPYLARMIAIIDAFEVMINDRPYSKAISKEAALAEIKDKAGSQFDPELVEKFVEIIQ